MNIRTTTLVSSLFLSACVMTLGTAQASTATYDLELNNLPAFSGQTLARVTLSDAGGGGVDFTVDALIPGTQLSQFGFNFLNDNEPSGFGIPVLPNINSKQWTYSVDINNQTGFDGFGKFDVDVSVNGDPGRVTPLTFHVTTGSVADYVALSVANGGTSALFAAHVTDLNDTGSGSCDGTNCTAITGYASGGTLVPLPAAVWLFGSGLLGLIGISRRKN